MFQTGERPNYPLMLDILSYLREYSDQFHHPREDMAFARLANHYPDLKPVLARLQQEHRVIANAGDRLFVQLTAILDDAVIARADVEAAAATYLVYYGNHIACEEKDVLAHAGIALTAEDWEAVNAAVPAGTDPLFGPIRTSAIASCAGESRWRPRRAGRRPGCECPGHRGSARPRCPPWPRARS